VRRELDRHVRADGAPAGPPIGGIVPPAAIAAAVPSEAPAHSMDESALVRIDAAEEQRLIVDVLRRLGAGEQAAGDQATVLVEADLRARPSHGVQRLPVIAGRIRRGLIRPDAKETASWAAEALLTVDGGYGLGPHVAMRSAKAIAERAGRTGIAAAAIRNTSHLGMLACYVESLAAAGLVGVAFTTSEALVHPWGGRLALVGTNPLALSLPTDGEPFVMDMATGAISRGEVIARGQRGEELPLGSAVDADGYETVDPAAAEGGAISPFGGPKGFALGLAIELLVAALTETALGEDVRGTLDITDPVTKGDVLIAVDPTAAGIAPFGERVGRYLQILRTSPSTPGSTGVAIPGDRAREERRRRLAEGIPLPRSLWRELVELREGVAPEASAHA
jgi:L-2-hydroxycarboxylate dehydrogenase (NAD+)